MASTYNEKEFLSEIMEVFPNGSERVISTMSASFSTGFGTAMMMNAAISTSRVSMTALVPYRCIPRLFTVFWDLFILQPPHHSLPLLYH